MKLIRTSSHLNPRRQRGFSLIETALALIIVGLAVGGMMQLLACGTMSNNAGGELTTAINLAKNIHEIAAGLAFQDPNNPTSPNTNSGGTLATANDIWDLNAMTFSPPVDCRGQTISNYQGWSQAVTVQTVDPGQLNSTRPNDPTVPTAIIKVTVLHQNQIVYSTNWLVCAPDAPPGP